MNPWEKYDEELTEIAQPIYEQHATERKKFKIIQLRNPNYKWYKYEDGDIVKEIQLPVITADPFIFRDSDGNLDIEIATKRTIKIADDENKLLSICKKGDLIVQAMPFACHTWKDHDNNVWAVFRIIINTEKTPRMADMIELFGRKVGLRFATAWRTEVGKPCSYHGMFQSSGEKVKS